MGTSKSFSASISGKPNWGKLSKVVTRTCGTGSISASSIKNIVGRYVDVIGGASKAGGGKSKIGGRASLKAATNLGAFLGGFIFTRGDVVKSLESIGLDDIKSKSISDIINNLIEYCSGPTGTIDDRAAKQASRILLEELIKDATTLEEMQENLRKTLDQTSLDEIIIKYFGLYIHEHLSVMFYEKLVREKGKSSFSNLFRQIKDFIFLQLSKLNKENMLVKIDWASDKAKTLIAGIQKKVFQVFENYED